MQSLVGNQEENKWPGNAPYVAETLWASLPKTYVIIVSIAKNVNHFVCCSFHLQTHMRNMWKNERDPTRCDYQIRRHRELIQAVHHPAPVAGGLHRNANANVDSVVVVVTAARRAPDVYVTDLARRCPTTTDECRHAYTIGEYEIPLDTRPRDWRPMQEEYDRTLTSIHESCSLKFWDIFLPVHGFAVNVIDTILSTVKKTFLDNKKPTEWRRFPASRRRFLEKTGGGAEFWASVKHTCRIDLTGVTTKPLASGTRSITFEFLDPVWAWLSVARGLPPEELHWKPAAQNSVDPVYGGGVQYGESFRQACNSCPRGGYSMQVGLHWDGTQGGGIESAPICIGCMNTNNCGAETQCCIAYIPKTPDQSRTSFAKTEQCTVLKWHIRQECCRAILRVLETAATKGVICTLKNRLGQPIDRLLFPRLVSMNFDQPEAQLFFGETPTGYHVHLVALRQ